MFVYRPGHGEGEGCVCGRHKKGAEGDRVIDRLAIKKLVLGKYPEKEKKTTIRTKRYLGDLRRKEDH